MMSTSLASLLALDVAPPVLETLDDLDWSALLSEPESSDDPQAASASTDDSQPVSSSDSSCSDACARRRERRASSARRRRALNKNASEALRAEAVALEEQLSTLRAQHAVTNWQEQAAHQRRKRTQAEIENQQLKRALAALRMNAHDLSSFLSDGFLNKGINMRDLLHTYTHLPLDPTSRAREYRAICSQEKLDLAFEIVTRETRKLRATSPQIVVHDVTSRDGELAMTMTARIVLDTTDLAHAFAVAGRAHFACSVALANFRQLHAMARAKEVPSHDIRYLVSEAQHASETTNEIVVFEEYSLTYWKMNPSCGVILWDFVDVDEMHPPRQSVDLRRHNTAGLVVHREMCPDGVERIVCSTVCTKILQFLPWSKPIVTLDTLNSTAAIASDMQAASRVVQQTMLENLRLPASSGTSLY